MMATIHSRTPQEAGCSILIAKYIYRRELQTDSKGLLRCGRLCAHADVWSTHYQNQRILAGMSSLLTSQSECRLGRELHVQPDELHHVAPVLPLQFFPVVAAMSGPFLLNVPVSMLAVLFPLSLGVLRSPFAVIGGPAFGFLCHSLKMAATLTPRPQSLDDLANQPAV
jgi:hypothetical protein